MLWDQQTLKWRPLCTRHTHSLRSWWVLEHHCSKASVLISISRTGVSRVRSNCQGTGKLPLGRRVPRCWERRQGWWKIWVDAWWVQRKGIYPELSCGGWKGVASVAVGLVPPRAMTVKIRVRQEMGVPGPTRKRWSRRSWCAFAKTALVSPSSVLWV